VARVLHKNDGPLMHKDWIKTCSPIVCLTCAVECRLHLGEFLQCWKEVECHKDKGAGARTHAYVVMTTSKLSRKALSRTRSGP
jgi:hypothetical protein